MNLRDSLAKHFRLTPKQIRALGHIGIATIRDLLFYFPSRYEKFAGRKSIGDLAPNERATIDCEVVKIAAEKTWKKRLPLAEAIVKDDTGLLRAVWFNQPYVAKMLPAGSRAELSGKVSRDKNGLYLANPTFELSPERTTPLTCEETAGRLLPLYPETYGITSRWLRARVKKILKEAESPDDPIPAGMLARYRLPKIRLALRAVHFPKTAAEAEAARKRFSFEEIFLIQLARKIELLRRKKEAALRINPAPALTEEFIASLPYELTGAQKRALDDILGDFQKPHPMARLLEGDVGSGKTVVAAASALQAVKNGFQVAFMAPTEILARQHFEEFIARLAKFRVSMGLLTSGEARKFPSKLNPKTSTHISKNQLLKWMRDGDTKILIGTHSLIQERVKFKKLGFAVVDEQHRFGTEQRRSMLKKNSTLPVPHFLSMTATPIPRTLALTIYADLDLSLLDEMPPGRKPVKTKIILPHEREQAYEFIRKEIGGGGQAFVVCPRIDMPRTNADGAADRRGNIGANPRADWRQSAFGWDDVKSVKAEYKKLAEEIFPDLRVGMLHGRLKPKEKEAVIKSFRDGSLDILVSTTVIEVGVDIPRASIMMIEGGERFGLATLHQLRGRVGRRGQNAYCFIFTTSGDTELRRLKALESAKTGFELAEYDLQFRGPGELAGRKQWGVSDVGMEGLKNIKMVEAARKEAEGIAGAEDAELKNYPLLKERIEKMGALHFE